MPISSHVVRGILNFRRARIEVITIAGDPAGKTFNKFNNLGVLTGDCGFVEWLPKLPVGPTLFRRARTEKMEINALETPACASLQKSQRQLDHPIGRPLLSTD